MQPFRPLLLACALACAGSAHGADDPWAASLSYEAKNDFAGAARVLQPYVNMSRPDEFALLRTGWLAWRDGNHSDAMNAYQRALQLNPSSLDARLGLSLPLMTQQRWSMAEQVLREVLHEDPLNYTANTRLMAALEAQQQWSELSRHARQFQSRYPADATILIYLARAQAALQQSSAARRSWERVLQRDPGNRQAIDWLKQNR